MSTIWSRWRRKAIGAAFATLTLCAAINALFLQTPRNAGLPGASETVAALPAGKSAETPVRAGAGAPPQPSEPRSAATPETIRAVQRELARRGYRVGAEDGRVRMIMREAIVAYEFDRGLPLTGEPDERLLKDMLFAPPLPRGKRDQAEARFEGDGALVRRVQQALAELGFGSPPVSGEMDDKTRAALRQFQANRKLGETGALSERTLFEIAVVTGKPITVGP
ncbi:MAG: peptidoglycan-binding domain-containing protein [Hyphomicrobiales bacterium]|nr:peptidoglycan-binding domain-containing protein [Hyphomicrobiales bacterium]